MARYIQSHTIAPEINKGFVQSRGLAEPLDGITEVWIRNDHDMDNPLDMDVARKGNVAAQ